MIRNSEVGFRVVDEEDRLLTEWGRLEMVDLIPGDRCWGKLVFTTKREAKVVAEGVPDRVQVAVNWTFPSQTYNIPLSESRRPYEVEKVTQVGKTVSLDRVVIEIEGNGVMLDGEDEEVSDE